MYYGNDTFECSEIFKKGLDEHSTEMF